MRKCIKQLCRPLRVSNIGQLFLFGITYYKIDARGYVLISHFLKVEIPVLFPIDLILSRVAIFITPRIPEPNIIPLFR